MHECEHAPPSTVLVRTHVDPAAMFATMRRVVAESAPDLPFGIKHRQREIGIRTALGADRATVARLFFRVGLRLSVIGLILGLPFSVLTLHVLTVQSQLPPTNLFVVSAVVGRP